MENYHEHSVDRWTTGRANAVHCCRSHDDNEQSGRRMRFNAPASSAVPCCTSLHAALRCSSAICAKYRLRNSTLQQMLLR